MLIKNVEIINKLFAVKSLLVKAGKKDVFGQKEFTVGLYELLKLIDSGADRIELIREKISDSPAALSQKVKKLQKLKYIKGACCIRHPRVKIFSLTAQGKKALKKTDFKINLFSRIIFSKYKREEREIFYKILNDFEKLLNKKIKEK